MRREDFSPEQTQPLYGILLLIENRNSRKLYLEDLFGLFTRPREETYKLRLAYRVNPFAEQLHVLFIDWRVVVVFFSKSKW